MSRKGDGIGSGLEVAQYAIDAWNREDVDAFLQIWHPDCEWRPAFPSSLEGVGTVYRGREGIARAWSGVRAVWDEYGLEVEEARWLGSESWWWDACGLAERRAGCSSTRVGAR